MTNAVRGLAAALAERLPVVVIGGEVPRSKFGHQAQQEGSAEGLDVLGIVRKVSIEAELISIASRACFQLRAGVLIASAQRRGDPNYTRLVRLQPVKHGSRACWTSFSSYPERQNRLAPTSPKRANLQILIGCAP